MAGKADSKQNTTSKKSYNICTPTRIHQMNLARRREQFQRYFGNQMSQASDNRKTSRTRLRQPFKSPVLNAAKSSTGGNESIGSEIDMLKHKIQEIDNQIQEMGIEYSEDELQLHIEKLHEYNEIKDVGQMLLGKIAEIEGRTTKMLYEQYGLDIED